MNIEARKQYMNTLRKKYFKANKKEKGEILNEYCRNTKNVKLKLIKNYITFMRFIKDKKGQENINSTNKLILSLLSFSTMAQKDNFGVIVK